MAEDQVSDLGDILAISASLSTESRRFLRSEGVHGLVVHELVEGLLFQSLLLLLLCQYFWVLAVAPLAYPTGQVAELAHFRVLLGCCGLPGGAHCFQPIRELVSHVLVHLCPDPDARREFTVGWPLADDPRVLRAA